MISIDRCVLQQTSNDMCTKSTNRLTTMVTNRKRRTYMGKVIVNIIMQFDATFIQYKS